MKPKTVTVLADTGMWSSHVDGQAIRSLRMLSIASPLPGDIRKLKYKIYYGESLLSRGLREGDKVILKDGREGWLEMDHDVKRLTIYVFPWRRDTLEPALIAESYEQYQEMLKAIDKVPNDDLDMMIGYFPSDVGWVDWSQEEDAE